MRRPRVRAYYPLISSYVLISRCIIDVGENFRSRHFDFEFVSLGFTGPRRAFKQKMLPAFVVRVGYRFFPSGSGPLPHPLRWLLEGLYLATMRRGDMAYLWPAASLGLYRRLHALGIPIAMEMINCAERCRQSILRDAYARRGLPVPEDPRGPEAIAEQDAMFAMADVIFAPSPWVERSLLEAGVPQHKIARTHFGWDPRTFSVPRRTSGSEPDVPTFLCVAHQSVRKGSLDLLEAWTRKRAAARLVLVGAVNPEIAVEFAELTRRADVELVDYSSDLAPFYARADVYIMPSYEEGSPIVVYFALAAGLAVVGTPASTSGLVEHGVQGLVCAPGDVEELAAAIDRMALDSDFRQAARRAAEERGQEVVWERSVAERVEVFERIARVRTRSSG